MTEQVSKPSAYLAVRNATCSKSSLSAVLRCRALFSLSRGCTQTCHGLRPFGRAGLGSNAGLASDVTGVRGRCLGEYGTAVI